MLQFESVNLNRHVWTGQCVCFNVSCTNETIAAHPQHSVHKQAYKIDSFIHEII